MATVIAVAAVLAAGCGGGGDEAAEPAEPAATGEPAAPGEEPAPAEEGEAPVGGTFRSEVEVSFDFTANFDPSAEYTSQAWGYYNVLLRRLVMYRGTEGEAGNELLPDLAVDMPEISDDELTYTFTLKDGIKFGPPVSREIVAQDFITAFERLANPNVGSFGYPLYYDGVIEGFTEAASGKADSISGITAPDDKTLVFKLAKPTGDFLYRLAMPAAGPVPDEVTKCFNDEAGPYGRHLIATGPYMLEGSEELDITSCETMKPVSGYDPEAHLIFVRNPDYDPATDTKEMRGAYVDRYEFRLNSNADDIFDKVKNGLIDEADAGETGKEIKEYTENEDLTDNLKLNQDDSVWYLSMNLTQPPWDDVHVRKAANFIMNKPALIRAWGGPAIGDPATHVLAPSMGVPGLEDYDPYPSPNFEGDLAAAQEEMKQSKYDTDKDGLCDAPECKDVLNIMGNLARDKGMVPVIEESLGKIGITMKTRNLDDPYEFIFTPKEQVPFTGTAGWGKDYPDPFTFFLYLFDGRTITPEFSYNEPLVGLTEEQAQKIGIEYPEGGVPSVDADIDACVAISDRDERLTCWAELDQKIMEEVVPWIPWLWRNNSVIISDAVVKWDFDQFSGKTSYVHVAVDESKQAS